MIRAAYRTLNLQTNASPEEVRAAYVRLVRRYPPEHFPDKFKAVQRAYQHLMLDDTLMDELVSKFPEGGNAVGLAGFLWGDDSPKEQEFDPKSLQSLLNSGIRKKKIDAILDKINGGHER